MEASNPELRIFLEDAFRMCSRHAYDKGYYPLEAAPAEILGTMANAYREVDNTAALQ